MPSRHTRARKGKRRQGMSRRTQTILLAVAAGVIVLGLAGFITADNLENEDSFCASCHSQPETQYYQRSLAAQPVDLASFHRTKATRCIDCHSGPGLGGRLGAMTVGAGDLFAWVTRRAHQPAPLTVPIGDGNCLKCHADALQSQDFNNHFHAFLAQWQSLDRRAARCVSCHSAHTTGGDPSAGYLQQAPVTAVCQACHTALGAGE